MAPFQAGDDVPISTFVEIGRDIAREMLGNPSAGAADSMNELQDTREKVMWAMRQLYQIMAADRVRGSDRECFCNASVRPRVRSIGEQLNALGGMPAMWMAYYGLNRLGVETGAEQPGDLRLLDYVWDGVGEWKA